MDRSLHDSLTRSTISMYASQYKLPENASDDVIYAPDEIITGGRKFFTVKIKKNSRKIEEIWKKNSGKLNGACLQRANYE